MIINNTESGIFKDYTPKGWTKTELENICMIILGQSPPSTTYNTMGNGLVFFQGKADFGKLYPKPRIWCTTPKKIAEKNDLLLSVRAPVGSTNLSTEQCCIGRGIAAIRSLDRDMPIMFFVHFFRWIEDFIESQGTGTTFKAISGQQIRKLRIPIPPLNEQKRIVTKTESIFAQIDATRMNLENIQLMSKWCRQSVLKHAFEGNLVPQDLDDEPAEVLLGKIYGSSEKELVLGRNNLPKEWLTSSVGQLYKIVGGGTPSTKVKRYWNGDILWISSADIHGLYDIRPRRKITPEAIKNSATNLVPTGSIIVVTRVGLGKIARTRKPLCFSQDSHALIGNASFVDPDYILYYLSQAVQFFKHASRGTTISGVTKKQIVNLPLPIAPFNEQKRIVSKIESIFDRIDATKIFVSSKAIHKLIILVAIFI